MAFVLAGRIGVGFIHCIRESESPFYCRDGSFTCSRVVYYSDIFVWTDGPVLFRSHWSWVHSLYLEGMCESVNATLFCCGSGSFTHPRVVYYNVIVVWTDGPVLLQCLGFLMDLNALEEGSRQRTRAWGGEGFICWFGYFPSGLRLSLSSLKWGIVALLLLRNLLDSGGRNWFGRVPGGRICFVGECSCGGAGGRLVLLCVAGMQRTLDNGVFAAC